MRGVPAFVSARLIAGLTVAAVLLGCRFLRASAPARLARHVAT